MILTKDTTHGVSFEKPRPGKIVTIDGTSSFDCEILEVSETRAQLRTTAALGGVQEFFLLLSGFGPPVFRRCHLVSVRGDLLSVEFPERTPRKPPPRKAK
jgi:hypothetical protein